MADAKICDRCESLITYNNERTHMTLMRDRKPYIFRPVFEELDLCDDCYVEFRKFLADGKKNATDVEV